MAVLSAAGTVALGEYTDAVWVGELALDGRLRPVRGVLPAVVAARRAGLPSVIVPVANLAEAALVTGLQVLGAAHLADVLAHLRGVESLCPPTTRVVAAPPLLPDMADVLGQPEARAALELAAAGGHHLAMVGPPGAGKTMIASRLPGILPPLTSEHALEVTAVHSVAGLLAADTPLVERPPFVDPHHSASAAAIVGGGSGQIRPGSISLAHRGVLFLDESPEFKPRVLDALRQPLEDGQVLVARASGAVAIRLGSSWCWRPTRARARRLVMWTAGASRERGDATWHACRGPLLDRIDIRLELPPIDPLALGGGQAGEPSAVIAERVASSRERSAARWRGTPWQVNGEVPGSAVRRHYHPDQPSADLLERAVRVGLLTGRGYDRVLRLALTSADLAGRSRPNRVDISRALAFRGAGTTS